MIRNSITSVVHRLNTYPFQVGSVVDMSGYTHTHVAQDQLVVQEATGLWVVTGFNLHQYVDVRHNNMWEEPNIDARKIFNDIEIELKWFKFAYPHMFEPAWRVPEKFYEAFDINGNTYLMNHILFDYTQSKYSMQIHQLFRENTVCCELHNNLKPSFGSCSISIFDGCGACCSNCPDWNYKDDEREGEDYTQSNRTIEHEN